MKTAFTILKVIFVAALLSAVALFVAPLLPIRGNIEIKIVKSGSMEPAIHTGSIVVIKPGGSYAVGDIVTFGADSKASVPTTHRIVSITQNAGVSYIETKGDANPKPDPEPTKESEIIGHVLFSIPYAGYILDFARQPVGFILLIAVPAALVVIYELIGIFEEIRRIAKRRRNNDMGKSI